MGGLGTYLWWCYRAFYKIPATGEYRNERYRYTLQIPEGMKVSTRMTWLWQSKFLQYSATGIRQNLPSMLRDALAYTPTRSDIIIFLAAEAGFEKQVISRYKQMAEFPS